MSATGNRVAGRILLFCKQDCLAFSWILRTGPKSFNKLFYLNSGRHVFYNWQVIVLLIQFMELFFSCEHIQVNKLSI